MYFKRFYYLFTLILVSLAVSLRANAALYPRFANNRIIADSDSTNSNVFIKVESTKKAVHVGENFIVKYMLYTAIQVIDPETNVVVKFNNCYQEDFSVDTALVTETINGKRYTVVGLKQYLVIPNSAGPLVLPQIKIQLKMTAVVPNSFFNEEKEITKDIFSTQGLVMVEKLPANPDSALFSGAVGKFKIKGSYTPAGKAKNMLLFHLVMEGIGNTKAAAISVPHFPEGIEVYNPNTTRHDSVTVYGIKTRLEFTFQVVANYRGKYGVPPVVFNYFDPERNKFVSFSSDPYSWQVDKGPEMIVQKNNAKKQNNDLYIEKTLYAGTNELFSYSVWYYIMLFIGILFSLYSFFKVYFDKAGLLLLETFNAKRNKYIALTSIQKLKSESSTLEEDVFWKRLNAILYKYIKGEANIPNQSISDLSFDTSVLSNNIPADLYQQVMLFLSNLQSLRFSAHTANTADKVQSCNQLITIVNALDTNWHE